jgi:hypothetical protein
MSWLRPTRRVSGPSGQEWEIYVTRGVSPRWKPAEYEEPTESELALTPVTWLLAAAVELPMLVATQVVWPLVRFVALLPFTGISSARSRTRLVEAVSFVPDERLAWRTAPADVPRVVDEVAAGLAVGKVPRPDGAVFLGGHP